VETPHGPHRALWIMTFFVTSSMEFMCSRDAGINNDDSKHKVGAQAALSRAKVGTTWPPWQW